MHRVCTPPASPSATEKSPSPPNRLPLWILSSSLHAFTLSFNAFSVHYRLMHKLALFTKHKLQQHPYGPFFNHPPTQQFYFLSLLSQGRNWDKQTQQNHCWREAISKTKLATELCFKYVLESQKQSSSKFFLKQRGNCSPVRLTSNSQHAHSALPLENKWHKLQMLVEVAKVYQTHTRANSRSFTRSVWRHMKNEELRNAVTVSKEREFRRKPHILEKVARLCMIGLPQKRLCKIILEYHKQRICNWMLSADPSKIILTPGFSILPAVKSEALKFNSWTTTEPNLPYIRL